MAAVLGLLCASGANAQDWAGLQRFADANKTLAAPAEGQPRVVLMGDSITEEWLRLRPDFFADNGYVGRGISGQVSAQMLVRFRQDVIDLHPAVVVINVDCYVICVKILFQFFPQVEKVVVFEVAFSSICNLPKIPKAQYRILH